MRTSKRGCLRVWHLTVAGMMLSAWPVLAGTYTWTNTADGVLGNWNDGAGWAPAGAPGSAPGDSAILANGNGSYTVVVTSSPSSSLSSLTLSNNVGQSWLVVSNSLLGSSSITLGNGGRLKLESGGTVTNTTFNWKGASGIVCLNQGGLLMSAADIRPTAVTAVVQAASATVSGGTWDFGNKVLGSANGAAGVRLELDGVAITNANHLYLGSGGANNTLIIRNGACLSTISATSSDLAGSGASGSGNRVVITGAGSQYACKGTLYIGGSGGTQNLVSVESGGTMTCSEINVGQSLGAGNRLVVTNGGLVSAGATLKLAGSGGNSNEMVVAGGGAKGFVAGQIYIGTSGSTGNVMRIDGLGVAGGAVITNGSNMDPIIGGVLTANMGDIGNMLIITHGGRFVQTNASTLYVGSVSGNALTNMASSRNGLVVSGPGSLLDGCGKMAITAGYVSYQVGSGCSASGNVIQVDNGAVITNVTTVTVGLYTSNKADCVQTALLIADGGQLYASAVSVGNGGCTSNNIAQVADGGLLEANSLTVGGTNNVIANAGGVYQFRTAAPVITVAPGAGNVISITNGAIAFRNVTNANVQGSKSGTSLTNITFEGATAFRLCNSANNGANSQSYVFTALSGGANYAGLEMMGGGTAYTNGSVSIAQDGWLTFSNTTAVMWGPVTNQGAMRIADSTVTFQGGLALQEGCSVLWSSNSVGNTVVVNGGLSLPSSLTLTLAGAVDRSAGMTLFQSSTAIAGTPNWTVVGSDAFRVSLSADGKRLVLAPKSAGCMYILE